MKLSFGKTAVQEGIAGCGGCPSSGENRRISANLAVIVSTLEKNSSFKFFQGIGLIPERH
jgi:hypothetical protein